MARFDLTDFEWSVIQPLLPTKVRGVPRVDDRRVLNGIFGGCVAERLGLSFPCVTVLTRPASTASTDGVGPATGRVFCKPFQPLTMVMCR